MSVKVVSPTDPRQPELPMSLRPQEAPATPSRGRSRQCLSPSPPDSRQPQLPIPLCPSTAAVESRRGAVVPERTRAEEGTAGAELPIPEQERPRMARPRAAAGVESGQLELSAPEQPQSSADPTPELPMSLGAPAADLSESVSEQLRLSEVSPVHSGSPVSAESAPEMPMSPRAPAADLPELASEQPQSAAVDSGVPVSAAPAPEVPLPPATGAEPDQSQLPMSLRPPASPAAAGLLAQARRGLAEAVQETRPAERFIGAYLAALRGAAAVLAARGRPHRGRARPASTWVLLDSVAPELREWSAFFASNSATRAAAQAGITGKVTAESAAGLVRAATPFLELVRRLVHGLPITGEAHVA
ncbi:SAV_6107 family HEPN domain-containing protein [Amycolatopsis sp. cmx-4-61]|uniref:SAV_6107 family HEPN domain-containing protein n=1 Tax=Amycolatopsis sp. cmx-4-61 TaxID=2790937 RepID=UPI003979FDFD